MEELAPLLFLAAIMLVFWLLIIRPNARRQKQQIAMQQAAQVGDQVMLTSGFYGTLTGVQDDRVLIEIAPGTTVTVARGAIGAVVPTSADVVHTTDPVHDEEA